LLYAGRALVFSNKADYDRAIADCDQALKLDPSNDTAYNNRAFALIRQGNYDRAIGDLDRAIKLAPASSRAYKNRGDAYRGKGDLDRALVDLDQAINLEPELVPAFTIRGLVYQAKGDQDLATADFSKALSLRAKPSLHYYAAIVCNLNRISFCILKCENIYVLAIMRHNFLLINHLFTPFYILVYSKSYKRYAVRF
jgi:tetratricopeptide (TPR) repeat protein